MVDIRKSEIDSLKEIAKSSFGPQDFINNNEVQSILKSILENGEIEKYFPKIVSILLSTKKEINSEILSVLMKIFGELPNFSIKSFRKYLRYKCELIWEVYRNNHLNLYQKLSYNIMNFLQENSLEDTVKKYKDEINTVSNITSKNREYIESLIKEFKNALLREDPIGISNASGMLKGLIKEFNSKSKEKFIKDYVEQNVNYIKDKFKLKVKNRDYTTESLEQVYKIIINNSSLRNTIRNMVREEFNIILEADEIEEFIQNVLFNNNYKNYEILQLKLSPKLILLQVTKSFNRLKDNFLPILYNEFSINQIEVINRYVNGEKIDFSMFTAYQKQILNIIKPLMKKACVSLVIDDDKIKFKGYNNYLDNIEEKEAKNLQKMFNKYNKITKIVFKIYRDSLDFLNMIDNEICQSLDQDFLFTDDNYELIKYDYIGLLKIYSEIVESIDNENIFKMMDDEKTIFNIWNLLINQGLINCFLYDNKNGITLAKVINKIYFINKGSLTKNFSIDRLTEIFKRAELCNYIDDFTLALLGEEVTEKIVYNTQFLQGKDTYDSIRLRLRKANDLMLRAQKIDTSGVPYFDSIEYKGLSIKRYNNNDSRILTSGIDSNTCFKLCANDNDYLFYSILNKHGMVAYFEENGELCGRITAHIRNNCLMINGIRNLENEYTANSLEQKERNDKIVEVVRLFAKKMIEISSNSNCPIDFVVSNKSGILESNIYDGKFDLVDNRLFTQYVDTYNDDFEEFRRLYDNKEQLFQEIPLYEKGCKQPFTTDFGHYPLVMIAKRENKNLERLWDISIDSPDSNYTRKSLDLVKGKGVLSSENIARILKIDALAFYYNGGNISDYTIPNYEGIAFDSYEIYENKYFLVKNSEIISKGYSFDNSQYQKSK